MSNGKNIKINKQIIDPSVKKPKVTTLSTVDVEIFYIMSKQSESSISITPNKEVLVFFNISTASTGTTKLGELRKDPKKHSADTQNKYKELPNLPT